MGWQVDTSSRVATGYSGDLPILEGTCYSVDMQWMLFPTAPHICGFANYLQHGKPRTELSGISKIEVFSKQIRHF